MKKSFLLVCLFNFLIAALMGLLLRLAHIYPVNINYQFLVHAHSHTAILGWAYMIIYCLIVKNFVPQPKAAKYNTLFWLTQITVTGMMVSFPVQGYALFSITFSTLHIFCSYYFIYKLMRDVVKNNSPSYYMLRASLFFLAVSTAGAWLLGAVGATGGKGSSLYYSSLQFFLHFQFNGWLIFAVLAMFFKLLENNGNGLNFTRFRIFFILLIISTILTLALPLSWYYPYTAFRMVNALGVVIQLVALYFFSKQIWRFKNNINHIPASWLLLLPLISLIMKITVQAITIVPSVAIASHTIRSFTIGFIHLAMLGVITGFIFLFIVNVKNMMSKTGIIIFYTGFAITELLLFAQGINNLVFNGSIHLYYPLLFAVSLLLPLGLIFIIGGAISRKTLSKI